MGIVALCPMAIVALGLRPWATIAIGHRATIPIVALGGYEHDHIVAKSAHSENMCIVVVFFQFKTIARDFNTLCTWGFFSVHYVFFQPPFR